MQRGEIQLEVGQTLTENNSKGSGEMGGLARGGAETRRGLGQVMVPEESWDGVSTQILWNRETTAMFNM